MTRPEFRRRAAVGSSLEPGTVREAHWWGGLSRLTGGGPSVPVLRAVVRIGWVLLLPSGLANVAYWSRPLDNGQLGRGAVSMRLFGLGLTVLLVSTICTVTMDLYALQCYSGGDFCRFDLPLSELAPASRVVRASLLPMAVLAGLWLLTSTSRARYEEYPPKGRTSPARARNRRSRKGIMFWAVPSSGAAGPWRAGFPTCMSPRGARWS